MSVRPIITLLTDFGERDAYVGAMKGVILNIAPDAQIVDISHHIAAQDIKQGAVLLDGIYPYYPKGAIHIVVVDPGVGSERQPIALHGTQGYCLAPDNGVLTYVRSREPESRLFVLDKPAYWLPSPSQTFHGRDIFSPVAAHLGTGVPLSKLGTPIEQIITFPMPSITITPTVITGEVLRIDSFGNALTNIGPLDWLDPGTLHLASDAGGRSKRSITLDAHQVRVTCGWHTVVGIHQNYSQVEIGRPVAVVGSNGGLEIAVNQGHASDVFSIHAGQSVSIHLTA